MSSYILIVDDEPELVWSMRQALRKAGHEVLTAYDGVEALAIVYHQVPSLVILDLDMPRMDGVQVCAKLRRDFAGMCVPVLLLVESSTAEERARWLEQGIDDYLIKPFDLRELITRVKTLLQHKQLMDSFTASLPIESTPLAVGGLYLDRQFCRVHVGDRVVRLTPVELDLLVYFMTHPGKVFSAQQLLQFVWGYTPDAADPGLVRWHIMNLRNKIETDPTHPVHIRTVPRHGYVMPSEQRM